MAYARPLARPGFPARANTIAQRKGLAYQKAVCKALLGHSGAWFEFEDAIGPGICQPDLYFTLGGEARALALVEIKLTYTQEAQTNSCACILRSSPWLSTCRYSRWSFAKT